MKTETITLNAVALRNEPGLARRSAAVSDVSGTVSLISAEAAEETNSSTPMRLVLPKVAEADGYSANWLLRVLACSYAKGVLSSEDIERKLRAESPPGSPLPDGRVLQAFRRLNRHAIEAALEKVLRILSLREVGSTKSALAAARGIGTETAVMLHYKAVARVDEAVMLDHAMGEE
jgi:hypothetical protein